MSIRIYFKHMPSSAAVQDYAEAKLGERLQKYHLDLVEIHLTVAVENAQNCASCHVVGAHGVTMTVTSADPLSMNAAIDRLADKIDARMRRKKEKLQSHRGSGHKPATRLAVKIAAETAAADSIDAAEVLRDEHRRHLFAVPASLALLGTMAIACGSLDARAQDARSGELVAVDATGVFVPIGFDDNDETELMVDGYLPSGCHKIAPPQVTIDPVAKKIEIVPMARQFPGPCLPVTVPYDFEVRLGQLDAGTYTVEVRGESTTLNEAMPVKTALGPMPDDYNYAPVDDVRVEGDNVAIWGRITNKCMRWDRAIVEDNGKTINVLPIVTFDGDVRDPQCRRVEMRYKKVVPLPDTVTAGRHLLHVRSMNGDAFNRLFNR